MQGQAISREPRTLLIGNLLPTGRRADPALTYSTGLASSPTLHEFNVIICSYSNAGFQRASLDKWDEWSRFLSAGGVAFIIGIEPSIQRHVEHVIGSKLEFDRESGSDVSWKQGPAIFPYVRDRRCSKWSVTLPRDHEKDVTVIGRNNAGGPVAFQVGVKQGIVVFLPAFEGLEGRKLVRSLVDFGEGQSRQQRSSLRLPHWAVALPLESESRLEAEKQSIDNRLLVLRKVKAVVVDDGPELSKLCQRVLQDILTPEGFSVSWVEKQGNHDLEMASGTLTIVGEVRGSKRQVDVEVVRQLLHHMQLLSPQTSGLKGVVIGNPHRLVPVSERQRMDGFTRDAQRLAELNAICLVTTVQLLEMYDMILSGRLSRAQFVELVKGSAGLLPTVPGGSILRVGATQ